MNKRKTLFALLAAVLAQPTAAQLADRQANNDALALYTLLEDNYRQQPLTCSMAQPVWDYQMATDVYNLTGQWTDIHSFDLMHLCYSPCDWINYDDITPVRQWHQQGGAVAMLWHWQVPAANSSGANYTATASETDFDPANVLVDGTWEQQLFYADLAEAASVLGKLQDEGIAVLWRPLHEAAGNAPNGGEPWFWWGKAGADVFRQLWQLAFSYLHQQQGLHNLVWVWTSCDDDSEWYPGDEYVDIIGTDIYNKSLPQIVERYNYLAQQYPDRMLALTECGQVPYLSIQWQAGCQWTWVMPWYGNDEHGTPWTADRWWTDAMRPHTPTAIATARTAAGTTARTAAGTTAAYTLDGRPAPGATHSNTSATCSTPRAAMGAPRIVRLPDGSVRKVLR